MWSPLGRPGEQLNGTAQWHPEPQGRGTWGILSSCLITLSLCLWSALHMNIPRHGTVGKQWLRKLKWLALGLIAPEFVALVAYLQWKEQRSLTPRMRKFLDPLMKPVGKRGRVQTGLSWVLQIFKKDNSNDLSTTSPPESSSSPMTDPQVHEKSDNAAVHSRSRTWPTRGRQGKAGSHSDRHDNAGKRKHRRKGKTRQRDVPKEHATRRHPWTRTHSFFAIMGGFSFEIDPDQQLLTAPFKRSRLVLTPLGLEWLAERHPGIIPDVSVELLADKNKSNHLAKTLACIQALWFCLQVITRMSMRIGVSLLELNTFAHAICALAVFCIWWNKLLDVEEPLLIPVNHEIADVVAYLLCNSRLGFRVPARVKKTPTWSKSFLTKFDAHPTAQLDYTPTSSQQSDECDSAQSSPAPILVWSSQTDHVTPTRGCSVCKYQFNFIATVVFFARGVLHDIIRVESNVSVSGIVWNNFEVEISEEYRRLCVRAERYARVSNLEWTTTNTHDRGYLEARAKNITDSWRDTDIFLFLLVSPLYAGWHLMAWEGLFPHPHEATLWRMSGVTIAVSGVAIFCIMMLLPFYGGKQHLLMRKPTWHAPIVLVSVVMFLWAFLLSIILFVVARVYLIVECYILLPYSQQSVFETPNWSLYFPHIS